MLRLHTSGTIQRIRAATLLQAATLQEGVRDLLFDAFHHVAQHERPSLATPACESLPPPRRLHLGAPHGLGVTPGRTHRAWAGGHKKPHRYHEPNIARPPPSTTPADTMAQERRTWTDSVTSLSNLRDHVQGDIPTPNNQQPAPSTYMTLMYSRHYTLFTIHYHAPTHTWLVHGTDSLLSAYCSPPAQPGPRHVHEEGRA